MTLKNAALSSHEVIRPKEYIMNKVRIMGIGAIISGILIGYFFTRTDVHLLSGMLIGLGVGWTITGKFMSHPDVRKSPVKSN